ncbi:hypothetical protein H2200_002334 [Cladophialophora chaetospira]|uniref:Zn(2)-C6 fungal-type domain-containing protein n=1 Tax=Cladophialophora chaetospira TaxID=386627 RepID=A0AA39CNG4_9EURO|nr:hypothetical protein H2200_002334 [Cladophialophora chaetospira]
MPSKTVKSKSAATVRSRTGCQTCRQRKLKCDEVSERGLDIVDEELTCDTATTNLWTMPEIPPRLSITFRHHQNSSFGKSGQDHNLDSFFKYSQTYSEEDKKGFLPVPSELTWVAVDPTLEDVNAISSPSHGPASDTYQQVAAHTLEALSTAAADQTTSYPPQGTAYYTAANPQSESHPEYGFVQTEPAVPANGEAPANISYFLSNSTAQNQTDTSLIDPNLESTVDDAAEQTASTGDQHEIKPRADDIAGQKEQEDSVAESESRLAITLRTFNELQA